MPVRGVRRRYILFKLHGQAEPGEDELWETVQSHVRLLYGLSGLAEAQLKLIEYKPEEKTGILRCSHTSLTRVRAALAHITLFEDAPAALQVQRVSGTIKALKRKTLDEAKS